MAWVKYLPQPTLIASLLYSNNPVGFLQAINPINPIGLKPILGAPTPEALDARPAFSPSTSM